ncbi:MAG: hypothetical protein WAN36_04360 [Calditrichia bacterium]
MNQLKLNNINLLVKLTIAAAVIAVMITLQSVWYNLMMILLLGAIILIQRIRIFRFPALSLSFLLFIIFIFIFRLFPGYGKILAVLPFGLRVTSGGILQAVLAVEQFMLVMLLAAAALYSSGREEIYYYLSRFNRGSQPQTGLTGQTLRVAMYSLFLLPDFFTRAGSYRRRILADSGGKKNRHYFQLAGVRIGDFIVDMLRESEESYPEFMRKRNAAVFKPKPLADLPQLIFILLFFSLHLFWFWAA